MTLSRATVALAAMALLVPGAAAQAQQTNGAPAAAQTMPPAPKPGPEHEILKQDVGTWDAAIEMVMPQGGAPMMSKGVETNTIGCGGLCLITDFRADLGGTPFEGHGTTAYDPARKKYVGSWVDSMSQGLAISEGTWDPATRTLTGWMEAPDASGKVTRTKSVVEYKGGTRVFTVYGPGPSGQETMGMRITYTKRK